MRIIDNCLQNLFLLKRNIVIYFTAYKFLSIYQNLSYQAYPFLFNLIFQEDYQYLSTKTKSQEYNHQFSSIKYKIRVLSVSLKKKIPIIGQPVSPPQNIPYSISIKKNHIEKLTTRRTSSTWAMTKYQSIYMWENVDMITQIIESRIDLNSHTTNL